MSQVLRELACFGVMLSALPLGQEGGEEEVCVRTGGLDRLYTEEKERLTKTKRDKYLQQYA